MPGHWGVALSGCEGAGVRVHRYLLAVGVVLLFASGSAPASAAQIGQPGDAAGTWSVQTTYPGNMVVPDSYTFVEQGNTDVYDVTNDYGGTASNVTVPPAGGAAHLDWKDGTAEFTEDLTFTFPVCGAATFRGTFAEVIPPGPSGTLTGTLSSASGTPDAVAGDRGSNTATIAAGIPEPPVPPPTYCEYRAKYTQAEKDAAGKWSDYYAAASATAAKAAAAYGGVGAVATQVPEPFISKGIATVFAIDAAIAAYGSADLSELAAQMSAINRDPPDPRWRTIAAPLKVDLGALPKPAGISAAALSSVDRYLTALLENAADETCVVTAINRAGTALMKSDVRVAKAQYRAGHACAAASARLTTGIVRLSSTAAGALRGLLKPVSQKARGKLLGSFAHDEQQAAFRRQVAARVIATLHRAIDLPAPVLRDLRTILSQPVATPKSLPTQFGFDSPTNERTATSLEHQSAQVLRAAGR
jgi:hypothetical protein